MLVDFQWEFLERVTSMWQSGKDPTSNIHLPYWGAAWVPIWAPHPSLLVMHTLWEVLGLLTCSPGHPQVS